MLLKFSENLINIKANTVIPNLRSSLEKRCSSLRIAFNQECMLNTLLYDLTKVIINLTDCQDIFTNSKNLLLERIILIIKHNFKALISVI